VTSTARLGHDRVFDPGAQFIARAVLPVSGE
jgi:hypothetical protein